MNIVDMTFAIVAPEYWSRTIERDTTLAAATTKPCTARIASSAGRLLATAIRN